MNITELAAEIEKRSGVDFLKLPIGRRFATRTPNGGMVMIKVGEPWPIGESDGSVVISMFQDGDDVHVYTLTAEPEAGKEPTPPTRYTISKHQPSIFAEIMAIETFIDEIANEWVMVDEGVSTAERERAAVVEFLRTQNFIEPTRSVVRALADSVEAEDHLEDDDDEPEGVVPSPNPATAAS